MTDKITLENVMVGSVVEYHAPEVQGPTRLDWQDIKWLSENEAYFNMYHNKMPITKEVLNKCPLPDEYVNGVNGDGTVYVLSNDTIRWYGSYISDLQLYFRSMGMEWDLSNLFNK